MVELWSPERKVRLERELWVAVMQAQRALGVDIPAEAIDDYRAVIDTVDLASIEARERVTRHDVKARIEEFSALAGHEHAHKGMTSRDLTENVEQLQVRLALELVRDRMVTALARLAERAAEHAALVMTGRTHNVAAQATTLGKRFANAGEELLQAHRRGDGRVEVRHLRIRGERARRAPPPLRVRPLLHATVRRLPTGGRAVHVRLAVVPTDVVYRASRPRKCRKDVQRGLRTLAAAPADRRSGPGGAEPRAPALARAELPDPVPSGP